MFNLFETEENLNSAELMTFKIIHSDHIDTTISSGNLYLGSAAYYAYKERTGNKGQGDKDEGLFARVYDDNMDYIKKQERRHGLDLLKISNGDFLDLKLHSVINMPVFCFYSINASDPEVRYYDEAGESPNIRYRTFNFSVEKRVLQDFGDENFGIINFLNHSDLYARIINTTRTLPPRKIIYEDREKREWCCKEQHPNELFYKDISFKYQKEARFIFIDKKISFDINAEDSQKFRPLNIGNIKTIVEKKPIKTGDIRIEIPRMKITEVNL